MTEMHFQVDAHDPIACEECGVQGEFVRFGKRDVPYRDLPIHGKRITLWVVRRRYTCRACNTFRTQLPEMVDGFRMMLRLHEYVEKEPFNHPYTFVAKQTGLEVKTVRDTFNTRTEFLNRRLRFETPRILGIDELCLNRRYHCILTSIEEKNREGRGYSFEVMRARMPYTTKHKKKAPDCEGLSVLQENYRLRGAGLRKGTQLRGRSINQLRVVSDWLGEGAPSTIKSAYPT